MHQILKRYGFLNPYKGKHLEEMHKLHQMPSVAIFLRVLLALPFIFLVDNKLSVNCRKR